MKGLIVKKLLKLALVVGGMTAVAKLVTAKKAEWQGLTEPQVREKLDSRLPSRIPEDKRSEVADKVVAKMRERGVLGDEDGSAAPAHASGSAPSADPTDSATEDNTGSA